MPLGQHGRSASWAGLLAFEPRTQAVEVEEMAAEQPFGCGHLLAANDAEGVCARKLLRGRIREAAEPKPLGAARRSNAGCTKARQPTGADTVKYSAW